MKPIVSLDIETTGFDPAADAIIEIGAVRFRGARVEAEFSSLVNPGRPLPSQIVQLTGITDAMLANAPRLSRILPELTEFIGPHPILGHNVGFDLRFLARHAPLDRNPAIDTFDLASVMLPNAGRYRLTSLAQALGVIPGQAHRGLPDARTTQQVFVRLLELAADLPAEVLREIVELGAHLEWGAGPAFDLAFEMASQRPPEPGGARLPPIRPYLPPPPLEPSDSPAQVDPEAAASILEPGGALAGHQPGYEHRSQQVQMTRAVAQALSEGRHLLVEAGTGTGKSMAYLIPAFLWAAGNGRRVVVSTNTINLQDQLIRKDIPALQEVFDAELRAAVLKGRSNYLCPVRLEALRRMRPRAPEEMRVLAKVLVWLAAGGTGERVDLSLAGPPEVAAWSRLSAEHEDCGLDSCLERAGGSCAYYKARTQAEAAHVLIVNHALLMADIQAGNRVLPEYRHLIIDEGHHLEAAITSGMTGRVTEGDLVRVIRELSGGPSSLLAQAGALVRRALSPETARPLAGVVQTVDQACPPALESWGAVFRSMAEFLVDTHPEQAESAFDLQSRILPALRTLPAWSSVEVAWDQAAAPLRRIVAGTADLGEALIGIGDGASASAGDLASALRAAARSLRATIDLVDHFIFEPDSATIYWAELSGDRRRLSLNAAPLAVGPLVERHLWNEKDSVIVTSATLTTAGEFDYLKRRLHADTADELALGSPFDYETSTLLYLVNDIPEPSDRMAYERGVEQALTSLAKAARGRMLALFTSLDHLRRTGRALHERLSHEGITVYEQGDGASRHALLESFRSDEQAVLLGTRSFWEGVDVPGEALSVLAMVRLPFDVPTDPIVSARAETYESPFDEYSLPEAILRFRQGFGRLIRTRSDRGAVVVLDRRILSKRYGQLFLRSLPTCTTRQGPLRDAPRQVARWLGM